MMLPATLDLLPVPDAGRKAIAIVRWPLLVGIAMLALAICTETRRIVWR